MKQILLAILMATIAHASQIGDIREMIVKNYATDPIGVEEDAVMWNQIVFSIVRGAKHEPLSPIKDYKKETIMVDDPLTKEIKLVPILLNDLKPLLILRALAKHAEEAKKPRPLVRILRDPNPFGTPPSSTR